MKRVPYFAYGSNLLTPRLTARCPSARVLGRASLTGYRFGFFKRSHRDGSGKASLHPVEGAITQGMVFELDATEIAVLDRFEGAGLGYDRSDTAMVRLETGEETACVTYIASDPLEGLRPFDWYLALILAGAAEHGLAANHRAAIADTEFDPDPDPARETRLLAIEALYAAGHADWQVLLKSHTASRKT